jgi:hypothetical protein
MSETNDDFDITPILKAIDNESNENIMKYTRESIHKSKNDILQQLQLPVQTLRDYHKKLKHFRYVDDLSDVKYGAFIRWVNISNPENLKLTNGGIVCDVKFYQTGVQIVCKNNRGWLFQLKFDECIIFQKLTNQEEVILDVITHLKI